MLRTLISRNAKSLLPLTKCTIFSGKPLIQAQTQQKNAYHDFSIRHFSTGPERMEFKAETKKLLDIVAKSIYTESEVFLRELLSNCSDAIEKQRYKELKGELPQSDEPFHINITTNEKERTLTIFVFLHSISKYRILV